MKQMTYTFGWIKRTTLTGLAVLTLSGFALAFLPTSAQATAAGSTPATQMLFGGGKDGNETHG